VQLPQAAPPVVPRHTLQVSPQLPQLRSSANNAAVVGGLAAALATWRRSCTKLPRRRGVCGYGPCHASSVVPRRAGQGVAAECIDLVELDRPLSELKSGQAKPLAKKGWDPGLGIVPPDDIRNRIRSTRALLGKHTLAFLGDTVWEYMVLRHQYKQASVSPFRSSRASRCLKQSKITGSLWRSDILKRVERNILFTGTSNSFKHYARYDPSAVEEVGYSQFSAAVGLRVLLGYLYMDAETDDSRLEAVMHEIGLLSNPAEEDELLAEVTGGSWNAKPAKQPTTFFLALAPLGNLALRLYVIRYMLERPPRDEELIARVRLALREEELDLASVGFMRDDATPEEINLMKAARDQNDTYAFAFECLLGHLALNKPYRMHQVVANFGWAVPLPGT